MTLQYKIHVTDIKINGHPITTYASNLAAAAKQFDEYARLYPFNLVTLSEFTESILKTNKPLEKPLLSCPRGHTGTTNEQPVIVRTSNGGTYCRVCGWVGGG